MLGVPVLVAGPRPNSRDAVREDVPVTARVPPGSVTSPVKLFAALVRLNPLELLLARVIGVTNPAGELKTPLKEMRASDAKLNRLLFAPRRIALPAFKSLPSPRLNTSDCSTPPLSFRFMALVEAGTEAALVNVRLPWLKLIGPVIAARLPPSVRFCGPVLVNPPVSCSAELMVRSL